MFNIRRRKNDPCPACGIKIPKRKELPFSSKKEWRKAVAQLLGYDENFILSLGEETRIHRHHFHEWDVKNNKAVGKLYY